MSDPLQTVLDAAEATKRPGGDDAFRHVSGVAELPGKDSYPALIVTLVDAISAQQSERGTGLISQDTTVTGIIYESVERITDLETEATETQTWTDVRALFAAFLHELYRDDPAGGRQARAPNARLEESQRSTRVIEGKQRYAIGWELTMSGSITPAPLT